MRGSAPAWLAQAFGDVPADDLWLSPGEAALLARLRFPRRRDSFRLGRWTAKRAIAGVLSRPDEPVALAAIDVRRAEDGAPEPYADGIPAPLSLSLSERAGVGVAVVGAPDLALGCDVERVEPRSAGFVSDYFTPAEQGLVLAAPETERDERITLVWSAKESALKALRTGLRRDTRSVVVALGSPSAGDWRALTVTALEGASFPGWWLQGLRFVVTLVADRATPPPVPLGERDRLFAALSSPRS